MNKGWEVVIPVRGFGFLGHLIPEMVMANPVSETSNAFHNTYGLVRSITGASTTGGIVQMLSDPNGVLHMDSGGAYLTDGLISKYFKASAIQFYGQYEEMKINGSNIGLQVLGIEKYDSSVKFVFGTTEVWIWGWSFERGCITGNQNNYISSVSDTSTGLITYEGGKMG